MTDIDVHREHRQRHAKSVMRMIRSVGLYTVVVMICMCVLAPFVWLIISSLSTRAELTTVPLRWIPKTIDLNNYEQTFFGGPAAFQTNLDLRYGALNSLIVAVSSTILCLLAGSLAAYAFTRLSFRGKASVFMLILATQLLPQVVIIIPLYIIMRGLHLLDTLLALIIADCAFILPLTIWLMRGFFTTVPEGLEEAARIDGCTRVGTIFRIVLPLSLPGLTACGIFAFIIAWNEFFSAFILSSSLHSKTISVLISEFSSKVGVDYVAMAAAGVLASLPPVILAFSFQRYIVQGLTGGAMKG